MEQQKQANFEQDQSVIRGYIWANKIPVKLVLHKDSICNDREPLPLYTFFQRVHHPIFYYQQIHEYFEKYAPVPRNQNDIWLEWQSKPVNWNIPFGVTFDLNYDDQSAKGEFQKNDNNSEDDSNQDLTPFHPIQLIIHYGPCNTQYELIPIQQGKDLLEIAKENFKFNVKEALQIGNDDRTLLNLAVEKQNQLWDSFVQHNDQTFFPILDELYNLRVTSKDKIIKFPARIYVRNYIGRVQICYLIQSGNETLGDLVTKYFPKIIQSTENAYEIMNEKYKEFKVLCNGIVCNLNMPLLYFYKYFFHYDGFTYLCIQY